MKTRSPFPSGFRVTLAFGFLAAPFGLFAQGNLTPPTAPAPTMKSLDQIQPRTPISSVPFVITQSGSYYLTTNLFVSTDAITINTNQVTLDLNGFTISSGSSVFSDAIALAAPGGNSDATIFNGHIKGGTTIFNGTNFLLIGFLEGIRSTNTLQNVRVSGVTVSGCVNGINLGTSGSTIVESCAASICANTGINAQPVSRCTANQCGIFGINAITASDCSGTGLSDGIGLFANTAQNCRGVSSNGFGLRALGGAHNCYGQSTSSLSLYANTAENCY